MNKINRLTSEYMERQRERRKKLQKKKNDDIEMMINKINLCVYHVFNKKIQINQQKLDIYEQIREIIQKIV